MSLSVEFSQSLSDMPARRAAASARSLTDGSMPSTLHDTREFMTLSGSDFNAPPGASSLPSRAGCKDNRIWRGSSASKTDFFLLR